MDTLALTTNAVAIAAISAIVVQFIKDVLIDPHMSDTVARTTLIQTVTYLVNFGLLSGVLLATGTWDTANIVGYISLAIGQTIGSHVLYTRLSGGGNPQPPKIQPPPPASNPQSATINMQGEPESQAA